MPPGRNSAGGFTLIEVLVAMVLVATVAANIAALCALAMRSAWRARQQTSAATLAQQKLEQLMALTWNMSGTPPGVAVSDLTTNSSVDPPDNSGSGLTASPAGSLDANTPGYGDFPDAN